MLCSFNQTHRTSGCCTEGVLRRYASATRRLACLACGGACTQASCSSERPRVASSQPPLPLVTSQLSRSAISTLWYAFRPQLGRRLQLELSDEREFGHQTRRPRRRPWPQKNTTRAIAAPLVDFVFSCGFSRYLSPALSYHSITSLTQLRGLSPTRASARRTPAAFTIHHLQMASSPPGTPR